MQKIEMTYKVPAAECGNKEINISICINIEKSNIPEDILEKNIRLMYGLIPGWLGKQIRIIELMIYSDPDMGKELIMSLYKHMSLATDYANFIIEKRLKPNN